MTTRIKGQKRLEPTTGGALAYYACAGAMTTISNEHASALAALPGDIAGLVSFVQSVTLHEYVAGHLYGFQVPDERKSESHMRPTEVMLNRILALDPRPLSVARPVDKRLIGVCRHFAVLLATVLRVKQIPARVRCGFGAYFNPVILKITSSAKSGTTLNDAGGRLTRNSTKYGERRSTSIMTFSTYRTIAF